MGVPNTVTRLPQAPRWPRVGSRLGSKLWFFPGATGCLRLGTMFPPTTHTTPILLKGRTRDTHRSRTRTIVHQGATLLPLPHAHPGSRQKLAKVGLANVGLAKVGHDRFCGLLEGNRERVIPSLLLAVSGLQVVFSFSIEPDTSRRSVSLSLAFPFLCPTLHVEGAPFNLDSSGFTMVFSCSIVAFYHCLTSPILSQRFLALPRL